ncbi:hypothetical protein PITC_049240 [Penicillium italicum]|uniref:Uncharacterized protein n=1 Tax=Penicillium italicum TaxID=40296 RepID=A0A0A2K6R0_PENIT|nr:hypothetical protein PITC_049240 [Penicillium italicum]
MTPLASASRRSRSASFPVPGRERPNEPHLATDRSESSTTQRPSGLSSDLLHPKDQPESLTTQTPNPAAVSSDLPQATDYSEPSTTPRPSSVSSDLLHPKDQPEQSTAQRPKGVSINLLQAPDQAAGTLGDSATHLIKPISDPSGSTFCTNGATSSTSKAAAGLIEVASGLIGVTSSPDEAIPSIENPTSDLPEPTTGLSEPTANNSLSDLSELEEGEIPPTPPGTDVTPKSQNARFRGSNPSPEPGLGQPAPLIHTPFPKSRNKTARHQVPVEGDDNASRKRKRSLLANQHFDVSRPPKKSKTRRAKQKERKKAKKGTCKKLGHKFSGFVSEVMGTDAFDFAANIIKHPVPEKVSKRLVFFSDASHRALCGAVGIVWPASLTSSDWEGKGVHYPISTDSTAVLELFGISCSLELAIQEIDQERATVPNTVQRTSSQAHTMTKEVFLFSDDVGALDRIRGKSAYDPKGEVGSQMGAISRHSKTLHSLGVHVELHLSPGHSGVPGNEAADTLAKKAMRELLVKAKTSWPTVETVLRVPTQPAPVPVSSGPCGRRRSFALPPPIIP